jgi:hypothetical protein
MVLRRLESDPVMRDFHSYNSALCYYEQREVYGKGWYISGSGIPSALVASMSSIVQVN